MSHMKQTLALAATVVALATGALGQARAEFTLGGSGAGWYDEAGDHIAGNSNYLAGTNFTSEHRNYFLFDLSGISDDILGATLKIFNPREGNMGDLFGRAYTGYSVSTSIGELIEDQSGRVDIFDDLGSGAAYGSTNTFVVDDYVTISLNSTALADLNAARGGLFAIGGALSPLTPGVPSGVFAFTPLDWSESSAQLLLSFNAAAVPEPATLTMASLAAAAGLGLGWWRRRRAAA